LIFSNVIWYTNSYLIFSNLPKKSIGILSGAS
jgi:hypothetical protein